jgi:cell division transport system permease protein
VAKPNIPGRDDTAMPPSAFVYFTREAFRRLWRAKRTSSVAVAMITIALFILGFFLLLADNLAPTVDLWEGSATVTVYLAPNATAPQIESVRQYLDSRPFFGRHVYLSQEEAFKRFRAHFSSLSNVIDQLDQNPFPASFDIEVTDAAVQNRRFDDEINALRHVPAVEDVQFDWQWIARIKNIVRVLNTVGVIAGGILAIAAAFTTANVIRLSMVLYREEISIMRLVGATETMVRGPFLLQGLLQGLMGGIAAVLLLLAAFTLGRHFIQSSPSVLWDFVFNGFLPWQKIAYLLLGGMLAGVIGSWFSLGEFESDQLTA